MYLVIECAFAKGVMVRKFIVHTDGYEVMRALAECEVAFTVSFEPIPMQ